MNSDFEKKLAEQPMRELPPEWRREILGVAKASVPVRNENFLFTIKQHLVSVLWPHPRAWAALAAVWVAVLAVSFSIDDAPTTNIAKNSPAPDWISALREQQRLMAELTRPVERAEVQRPKKITPSPRSDLRKEEELFFV